MSLFLSVSNSKGLDLFPVKLTLRFFKFVI